MVFARAFVESASAVWSERVRAHLARVLSMIETFPESGSAQLPDSIFEEFGPNVRKCALTPFDVIYRYEAGEDTVYVLGLVHQRFAR